MKINKKYIFWALSIIVIILVIVILLFNMLKEDSKNNINYNNYDVVASVMADKTKVNPGDEITVKLSVDKMPDNGYGIKGINARIAYDPTKLTIEKTTDEYGFECDYIVPGDLGEDMSIRTGTAGVVTDVESGYVSGIDYAHKVIGIGTINDYTSNMTGVVVEIKFRVNEGATGNLGMFVYPQDSKYSGFNVVGVNIDEDGELVTDLNTSFYLISNIEDINIK